MEYVFELLIKRAFNKHNALLVNREAHNNIQGALNKE